jgi:excisionase family DNA binding protein
MGKMSDEAPAWLGLKQAAHYLGVHPTTLRRWANNGDISYLSTPGGHRRFELHDLERFAEDRRRLRAVAGVEQTWAEHAVALTRQEIASHQNEHWLAAFDEQERESKRQLGRRLMGLTLQFVAGHGAEAHLLDEARAIGRAHAENTLGLGLPLTEALQAMLFFRDTLVEAAIQLPEVAHVRPEANQHLLRRINTLLNAVQLAVADTYEKARP